VMRGAGGRGPRAALTLHMKEFLRPLGANQARTRLRTVIKELELCMKKYSGLDWQPLGHLLAAAQGLEEAQRVAMYGQVFAFYLGCVPRLEASEAPRAPGPLGPLGLALQARSGFTRRPYAETDPRTLDAEMFYRCLEQLEVAVHQLSTELLVTVEAALLIRLAMEGHQEAVKVHLYGSEWSLVAAQATIQTRRSQVMDRLRICQQRGEAIVRLMEEGFGERVWTFRAVKA